MCHCAVVHCLSQGVLLGDLTIILFGDGFIDGNLTLLIQKNIVILMCWWPLCHPAINICCTESAKGRCTFLYSYNGRCTLLYRACQCMSHIVVQDVPCHRALVHFCVDMPMEKVPLVRNIALMLKWTLRHQTLYVIHSWAVVPMCQCAVGHCALISVMLLRQSDVRQRVL